MLASVCLFVRPVHRSALPSPAAPRASGSRSGTDSSLLAGILGDDEDEEEGDESTNGPRGPGFTPQRLLGVVVAPRAGPEAGEVRAGSGRRREAR